MCHMSRVTCHMSGVRCHVSGVRCHMYFFLQQSGGAIWVCYQRGLPRLVSPHQPGCLGSVQNVGQKFQYFDNHDVTLKVSSKRKYCYFCRTQEPTPGFSIFVRTSIGSFVRLHYAQKTPTPALCLGRPIFLQFLNLL